MKLRKSSLLAIVALLVVPCMALCRHYTPHGKTQRTERVQAARSSMVTGQGIGSPLLKVGVPAGVPNVRLDYDAMIVYFNPRYHVPNCVIYDYTATLAAMSDAPGAERRKNYKFNSDPNCSSSPDWSDYRGSGYDRGHMAPAMDMRWSPVSMTQCFYMTNMCPQEHGLNGGCWRTLEQTVHKWTKRDKRLIIATGPVLGNGMDMIGPRRNIAVPKAFFKAVYAPAQGRAIAFLFNNVRTTGGIKDHVVSVSYVERVTGLSLFPGVSASIKSKSDYYQWK